MRWYFGRRSSESIRGPMGAASLSTQSERDSRLYRNESIPAISVNTSFAATLWLFTLLGCLTAPLPSSAQIFSQITSAEDIAGFWIPEVSSCNPATEPKCYAYRIRPDGVTYGVYQQNRGHNEIFMRIAVYPINISGVEAIFSGGPYDVPGEKHIMSLTSGQSAKICVKYVTGGGSCASYVRMTAGQFTQICVMNPTRDGSYDNVGCGAYEAEYKPKSAQQSRAIARADGSKSTKSMAGQSSIGKDSGSQSAQNEASISLPKEDPKRSKNISDRSVASSKKNKDMTHCIKLEMGTGSANFWVNKCNEKVEVSSCIMDDFDKSVCRSLGLESVKANGRASTYRHTSGTQRWIGCSEDLGCNVCASLGMKPRQGVKCTIN